MQTKVTTGLNGERKTNKFFFAPRGSQTIAHAPISLSVSLKSVTHVQVSISLVIHGL